MTIEKGDILGTSRTIITIMMAAFFIVATACACSAEAYNNGATRIYIRQPLPYQSYNALITNRGPRYRARDPNAGAFHAIAYDIRARFEIAAQAAALATPPDNRIDSGAQFAQRFASASGFHIIAHDPSSAIAADSIFLTRDAAASLISLPQADEVLLASHFIQPLFGSDYVIWPHQQAQPIDSLSYQAPLWAMVRYGDWQIARPFSGQITLSFEQFDGHITLSDRQQAFALFFRIDDWQTAEPLHLEALLRHGADDYPASLLLAYTSLPHSAIWGYFRNHHTAPAIPLNGYFSNFTLPDD